MLLSDLKHNEGTSCKEKKKKVKQNFFPRTDADMLMNVIFENNN